MSADKSVWPGLVGKMVRMGHTEGVSDGALAYSHDCETYRAGSGPWKAIENIRSIEPLEEPFVPGDLKPGDKIGPFTVKHNHGDCVKMECDGGVWAIENSNVKTLIDALGVSVHKPETPVDVAVKVFSHGNNPACGNDCVMIAPSGTPAGDYLAFPESAIDSTYRNMPGGEFCIELAPGDTVLVIRGVVK